KPGSLDGGKTVADANHLGDTITNLNTVANFTMLWVLLVVYVGHEPLVDTEASTWLQDLVNLAVNTLQRWGVNGSLDGVNEVEGVWLEAHLHEVALDKFLSFQLALFYCVAKCGVELTSLSARPACLA